MDDGGAHRERGKTHTSALVAPHRRRPVGHVGQGKGRQEVHLKVAVSLSYLFSFLGRWRAASMQQPLCSFCPLPIVSLHLRRNREKEEEEEGREEVRGAKNPLKSPRVARWEGGVFLEGV